VSARALAASATGSVLARRHFPGGFLALDYFGDADLAALANRVPLRALSLSRDLGRPRTASALARAALGLEWEGLAYSGGLENRPGLLKSLARRGRILGNRAEAVARVRDPRALFGFLRRAGIPHAPTWTGRRAAAPGDGRRGLWKGIRSGGGMRVLEARPGQSRPRGFYRQEFLAGTPGSASFVADGKDAVLLGVSEQLSGWRALGVRGFRYGGSIAGPAERLLSRRAAGMLDEAVAAITRRFRLRGLNGVDFILSDGVPRVIEVNPRYTASMELLEELSGVNFFDLHLAAILAGDLPGRPPVLPASRFMAKGILYAERDVRAADPGPLARLGCRDLPVAGEAIAAGHPICTVIARARSLAACRRLLLRRAAAARRLLRVKAPPGSWYSAAHPCERPW
jgi:predicted ATP-grasp superfamily ATP-dependent carboligase